MLHPDSHNMFENGSFLRRRRRFKQESGNGTNRNQQQNGNGGRQRGQLHQRNSPNLISPSSTNSTNGVESKPHGTKSSRTRNQTSNSTEKESLTDEAECLESPRKVSFI